MATVHPCLCSRSFAGAGALPAPRDAHTWCGNRKALGRCLSAVQQPPWENAWLQLPVLCQSFLWLLRRGISSSLHLACTSTPKLPRRRPRESLHLPHNYPSAQRSTTLNSEFRNVKDVMLSEINQTEKDKLWMSLLCEI